MPRTFEAIFFQSRSKAESVEQVRQIHAQLLIVYGLEARTLPLVVYDEQNPDSPFELAYDSGDSGRP